MTISTLANQVTVYGDGATTVFDFSFVAVSANYIQVVLTDSSGIQTTIPTSSYLVALNPIVTGALWQIGGTVSYPISGAPLAAGNSLTISRVLPLTQDTDISNQGNFYPTVVEKEDDTLLMQIQQVNARTGQIRGTWLTTTLYNFGDIVVDGTNGANTGNLYTCSIPNTSGTWSTDLANGDWSLALNVQSIVNSLPSIGNNQVFGNITGGGTPIGVGVSALLNSAIGSVQGDIMYRSASGWTVLPPGTSGQVLSTQGAAANPQWANGSGSGSVTNVATGTGLTGGPITTTGTVSLATVADNSILANISGGSAAPGATTLSALLDNILGSAQGDIIYRGATGWVVLVPGTSGQVLTTQGAAANPIWAAAGSGTSSLGQNGYKTYTDGFVDQWGFNTPGTSGLATITFPLAFPTACFGVVATVAGVSDGKRSVGIAGVTTANFTCYTGEGSAGNEAFPIYWRATGN